MSGKQPDEDKTAAKNSRFYITRSVKKDGKETETGEEGVIAVHRFQTNPAEVNVDYGITLNMGNYESAKINLSVRIPCYKEEIDEAYEFASAWVADRLERERDLIRGTKKGHENPL